MTALNVEIKTYRADNLTSLPCPIFGAEVELRQCLGLRDAQFKGRRVEARKGCQACITSSKCPAASLVQYMDERHDDVYYSATPKTMNWQPDHLARVSRIVVPQSTLTRFADMPEHHRDMILAANGNAGIAAKGGQIASAPKRRGIVETPAEPAVMAAPGYADVINAMTETQ